MPLKIKLSDLAHLGFTPEAFAERVIAFVKALEEYAAHLDGVKLDADNPDLKPEEKRVAFPGPSEHPLIESVAREGYELHGPSLDEKKAALTADVRAKETSAIHRALPPAKIRHWQFREQDIRAKLATDFNNATNQVPAQVTVSDEENLFMQDIQSRHAKAIAASRWAAKHEHDIHDLTEETVDQYHVGTFA